MSQDSHVYTPNLVRIVREGGIPLAFSLSIRDRARRERIAHGIGTTEGPYDRSRGQSGLFMRMRKTPSKAL